MNQAPQQSQSGRFRNFVAISTLVCRALACSVEVMLHDPPTFGLRYIGAPAAAAAVIMGLFPIFFFSDCSPDATWWFVVSYVAMLFVIRGATLSRRARGGPQEHSYYSGLPLILRIVPKLGERSVKLVLEPLLVGITGLVVQDFDRPLGTYLVIAAVGLAVSVATTISAERRRATDLHDVFLEQRHVSERFRRMRGE